MLKMALLLKEHLLYHNNMQEIYILILIEIGIENLKRHGLH